MDKMTIKAVKQLLADQPSQDLLEELKHDSRKGVQTLLTSYHKSQAKKVQQEQAFFKRLTLEKDLWQKGITYVGGIDEVGRGPLAGPVVSCCIILPHDFDLIEVNDSKQLTAKTREELYGQILMRAVAVGIGVVDNRVIDEINIYEAARLAMKKALLALDVKPQHLLIDAMQIETDIKQTKLIKGDAKSASIAAASIVAKVYRDHLMSFYDRIYPGYHFSNNDGYGTKEHLAGLAKLGVCPIHRLTFEPIKSTYFK